MATALEQHSPAPTVNHTVILPEACIEAPVPEAKNQCLGAKDLIEHARRHADQGHLEEASQWCDKAVSQDRTNAAAYYLWAVVREEQGRLDEAGQLFRKALYYQPKLFLAHYALGNVALKQRRPRDARKHFSNALDILAACRRDDVVPQSGGLTAGRLREMVNHQVESVNASIPDQLEGS
jgi:chemotaxis protein methyltransferase CheR